MPQEEEPYKEMLHLLSKKKEGVCCPRMAALVGTDHTRPRQFYMGGLLWRKTSKVVTKLKGKKREEEVRSVYLLFVLWCDRSQVKLGGKPSGFWECMAIVMATRAPVSDFTGFGDDLSCWYLTLTSTITLSCPGDHIFLQFSWSLALRIFLPLIF